MIFSSFQFLFFLIVVMGLLIVVPGSRWRKLILLVASYYFYAFWDVRFTALIFTSTIIDYFVGRQLALTEDPRRRKLFLLLSMTANLGFLGFFKYYNFFVDSAEVILSQWGIGISNLDIILPVGISFYTFQTMSYTIDIFRRKLEPVDSFSDFALFVAFFPQLVAGPIVRAADFLPQLKKPVRIRPENVWAGSQIFIVGLFKKLMIADAVAPFVDRVFAYPDYFSSPTAWLAIIAYAIQIYCDFSGYSDMAIGTARMLGFHFERNFFMPYISQNIAEFWRRWHISLSSWLRDYLYISLGGNRRGQRRTYVNLMITMILGGLWHGASWNFVIWGTAHGVALAVHRYWSRNRKGETKSGVERWLAVAGTFLFVTLIWVLFRAQDTSTMLTVYSKLFFLNPAGANWFYTDVFVAIAIVVIAHIVGLRRRSDELVFFSSPYSFRAAFVTVTVLLIIFVFAPT
ncbi:MAG: MBOAT family protein, partial [Anaerolineales bacterium]|nr:MBOAT family protein [Anaerolineales bacterium]